MATPLGTAKDQAAANSGCLTALRRRHQDKYKNTQPYHLTRHFWNTSKLSIVLENQAKKNPDHLQSSDQRRKIVHLLGTLGNPVEDWRALLFHLQGDKRDLSRRHEAWKAMSGRVSRKVQYGRMPSKLSNNTGYRYWRRKYRKLANDAEWLEQAQEEHRAQQLLEQFSQDLGDSESEDSDSADNDFADSGTDPEWSEPEDEPMSDDREDPLGDLERATEELNTFEPIDYSQFATDPMGIAFQEAADMNMEQLAMSNEVEMTQSNTELPGFSTQDDDNWDPYNPFANEFANLFAQEGLEAEAPSPSTSSAEFSSSSDFDFSDFDGSADFDLVMGLSEDEDESDESEDEDSEECEEEDEDEDEEMEVEEEDEDSDEEMEVEEESEDVE